MTTKELTIKQMDYIYKTASMLTLSVGVKTILNNLMGQACGMAILGADICRMNGESNDSAEIVEYFNEVISKKIAELYKKAQEVEE